jgi:branched-chain amino acid transport system permease protein
MWYCWHYEAPELSKDYPLILITGSSTVLSVVLSNQQILSASIAFGLVGVLVLFLQKTKMGRAIRGVTQDRETAAMCGINAEEMLPGGIDLNEAARIAAALEAAGADA